mgnify:CR=1 FL=1
MSNINLNNLYRSFTIARNKTSDAFSNISTNVSSPQVRYNIKAYKNVLIPAALIALLLFAFALGKILSSNNDSGKRISAPAPVATQMLNKSFEFPLKDDKGKTVSNITYLMESANLQDSFIYQGKLANAVKGRTFLIFNLKITNPYTKTIEVNAKDYVRVKVNGSSEQLAPEIHNDPVQIQANSTKYTRIGLPINESDKNIIILIGELTGKKQSINLSLKR